MVAIAARSVSRNICYKALIWNVFEGLGFNPEVQWIGKEWIRV
jgi:hypothetical protein